MPQLVKQAGNAGCGHNHAHAKNQAANDVGLPGKRGNPGVNPAQKFHALHQGDGDEHGQQIGAEQVELARFLHQPAPCAVKAKVASLIDVAQARPGDDG